MKRIVTGAAGFIGFHLSQYLLEKGIDVLGVDNLNDYYPVSLKEARLAELRKYNNFRFVKLDICERDSLKNEFAQFEASIVYHLAAQAGVRYSMTHPFAYTHSNVEGFLSILEACRAGGVEHLVYASSSSVYGANEKIPFKVSDPTDSPISLYAATKKANELMAQVYSGLHGLKCTGLRFFTVYGPWGRPDMAYYTFVKRILAGQPITLFNNGEHQRDFTYIDDIVDGIYRVGEGRSDWQHRVFNIGNSKPVWLKDFVATLEKHLDKKAVLMNGERMPGDVLNTAAYTKDLESEFGFKAKTEINEGLGRFVDWYRSYHRE